MDFKQIVDIMDNQSYYVKDDKQTIILKKPVVVKTFDNNNISLSVLRTNEDRKVYTETPQFQWQTYQFTKEYRLHKIEGKLYANDNRLYDYECQYMNLEKQWISLIKQQGAHRDLHIELKPKLWALGIRFQGTNTKNDIFHLNKLNIFAEVGTPDAQEGVKLSQIYQPQNYDKRKIINLFEKQLVYKKINNYFLATPQQVIKKIDENNDLQQLGNQNIDNFVLQKSDWVTYQFAKKYKLQSIVATKLFIYDAYKYEVQILNKLQEWVQIYESSKKQDEINLQFAPTLSASGIRIRKSQGQDDQNLMMRTTILAETGSPIIEQ